MSFAIWPKIRVGYFNSLYLGFFICQWGDWTSVTHRVVLRLTPAMVFKMHWKMFDTWVLRKCHAIAIFMFNVAVILYSAYRIWPPPTEYPNIFYPPIFPTLTILSTLNFSSPILASILVFHFPSLRTFNLSQTPVYHNSENHLKSIYFSCFALCYPGKVISTSHWMASLASLTDFSASILSTSGHETARVII